MLSFYTCENKMFLNKLEKVKKKESFEGNIKMCGKIHVGKYKRRT